jgi:hypothetical protein
MATGDMDKDGFEDFVVGAPGYNVKGSPQEGRVYIIYGNLFPLYNRRQGLNVDALLLS